jgi:hypothetical protein
MNKLTGCDVGGDDSDLIRGTKETTKIFSQISPSRSQDLDTEPPEYEDEMLSARQRCLVTATQ